MVGRRSLRELVPPYAIESFAPLTIAYPCRRLALKMRASEQETENQ